ncbi:MAG: acyltransferase, partial [Chlorobiaceae bacterium]|nr:acyltransferase [Chlorobiaceae bacterium]
MNSDNVTIALIQSISRSSPAENLAEACLRIREAAASGAQIVCLQELFSTSYFCQTEDYGPFDYAEPVPGPATGTLQAIAAELEVVIVASLF